MQYRVVAITLALTLAACGGGSSTNSSNGSPTNPLPAGPATTGSSAIGITEYSLGTTPSSGGITIDKDGSVWTESNGPSASNPAFVRWFNGKTTSYPVPMSPSGPYSFLGYMTDAKSTVYGATVQNIGDGNYVNDVFGVPSSGGSPQRYPNASFNTGSGVYGSLADLTSLSDGSVWEAESFNQIGVSGQGTLVEVSPNNKSIALPTGQDSSGNYTYSLPTALAQGPDGNLWVSVQNWVNPGTPVTNSSSMLVYSTSGTLLHTYALEIQATSMVAGPDGAMWYTRYDGSVGRMTVSGANTDYKTNTVTALGGIAVGGDKALWFLEPGLNRVARMSTSGAETDYAIPTANSNPMGIAGPPPGCPGGYLVWFAEAGSGKIALVRYQ